MDIGLKIRELRISKGMTQEKLAEETNLSTRTIQRIESGDVDPRANSLQVIAKALEVDYDYFKEEEKEEYEERTDQDSLWLAAMHLSMTLHLFFPTFILWKMKKDSIKDITKHFRDLITVQLFFWLIIIIPGIIIMVSGVGRGAPPASEMGNPWYLIIGFIMSLISAIDNAVKVANNKPYNYLPFKKDKDTNIEGK